MVALVGVLCEKPWTFWRSSSGPSHPRIDGGQVSLCDQVSDLHFTQLGSVPSSSFSCSCFPHFSLPTPLPPLLFLLIWYWQSVCREGFRLVSTQSPFPWKVDGILWEWKILCRVEGDPHMGTVALGHCDELWQPKVSLSEMPWIKYLICSKCESAALNMPANLENSAVAKGLEKVSFHSNPKERQCQRMLKLPHNCTDLTR